MEIFPQISAGCTGSPEKLATNSRGPIIRLSGFSDYILITTCLASLICPTQIGNWRVGVTLGCNVALSSDGSFLP